MRVVVQTFLVVFICLHLVSGSGTAQDDGGEGLYDSNDYVISLYAKNLKTEVYDKDHASLVEFYNSYCGFCRRFAPTWKRLAEDILGWRSLVIVAAIDCARDENSDICREFEIMAYPTIRYFAPHFNDGPQKIGIPLKGHNQDDLTDQLVQHLQNAEKPTKNWPNFSIFNETDNLKLFDQNNKAKFAFLVNDNEASSKTAEQIILDFFTVPDVVVRKSQCNATSGVTAIDAKTKSAIKLPLSEFGRHDVTNAIKDFLKSHGVIVAEPTTKAPVREATTQESIDDIMRHKQDEAIDKKVKEMKGTVFQADLEMALRFALFEEVARFKTIDGERLLALQRFMNVLVRYFPFGDNGMKFLKEIRQYVVNAESEISGQNFSNFMHKLEEEKRPIFSADRWVGCHSNLKSFRKYPCGLWTIFHYLTVQAAEMEISTDPLEILQAMHGYIKYYFGCTHCSEHFQQMAARNKIWNVTSKDDAVLWLWSSHNEVNNRLQGDDTSEDPEHPKIQFPSEETCPHCRKRVLTNHHNHQRYGSPSGGKDGIEWDLVKILEFLKAMYSYEGRNFLGLNDERLTPLAQAFVADGSTRSFGNILSELDMRMGALLYVLCIVIMVVAVKMVVKRGYRKKLYIHDLLGKV